MPSSFNYELVIKEHHLDSYQHVNNATYLSLYEEARWEAITQKGYGYKTVQQTGLGPIILEINLKFLKEIKLREKIIITLEVVSYVGKICILRQQMLRENREVASEVTLTTSFFDLKARKLIPPSAEWLKALDLNS